MINPHDAFLAEEFLSYGAECRRMAALAGDPPARRANIATSRPAGDWLVQFCAQHFSLPRREQKLPARWAHQQG